MREEGEEGLSYEGRKRLQKPRVWKRKTVRAALNDLYAHCICTYVQKTKEGRTPSGGQQE